MYFLNSAAFIALFDQNNATVSAGKTHFILDPIGFNPSAPTEIPSQMDF
jgi:hypothetical protein